MKKIKRLLARMLFSKHERIVIWNALWYSHHTYLRRGNVDEAVSVRTVMNSVEHTLGANKETYTKEEVDKIVNEVIDSSAKFFKNALNDPRMRFTIREVGTPVYDMSKCDECPKKEHCELYNSVFKKPEETEEKKEETSEETEETKEKENPQV